MTLAAYINPVATPATSSSTVTGRPGSEPAYCRCGCMGGPDPSGRAYTGEKPRPGEVRPCSLCGKGTRADVCLECVRTHRDGPKRL